MKLNPATDPTLHRVSIFARTTPTGDTELLGPGVAIVDAQGNTALVGPDVALLPNGDTEVRPHWLTP